MLFRKTTLVLAAACALGGGALAAQHTGAPSAAGAAVRSQAADTPAMQQLREAADRLRQSIQALAQQAPGPQRERAIVEAHQALLGTQQAMMDLPPHLRSSGGSVSAAGYDESVKKLMKSADSLRQAIQEMAQQPAGERRNQAIRDANKALWDTRSAMIAAYQPGSSSQAMGASGNRAGSTSAGGRAQAEQQASRAQSTAGPAAVLVLLPNAQAQGTQLANGCWVRFFDDKGFQGDTLTLAGPVDIPRMELGDAWRDWDSAIVGPKATVRTYDNENFRERTAVLQAGQSIRDLGDRKLGWFDEVKSARVACG